MNEKIKQLISQSYEYAVVTTIDPFTQEVVTDYIDGTKPIFDKEKFAELIVQECIDTLSKRFMGDLNREDMEIRRCIEDVKKCFGVEECPNPNLIS